MKSLGRNKFLSIMQSHLICEAPLKDFDLNYIFIPSLIIKDGNETYYSDLHYRETSYMEYDRPSPTVEFDFRFEYKEHIIEEFNVYQRRVSFNNNMQNYKDTIFYSKEINDMYLIFYKNRRHYSREIFDVSIYYISQKLWN